MRDYLKIAKEWLPLSLAAAYFLGFVIVGLHLAGYGASSLDLIKVQYLAAGFWFCFSCLAYFGALKGLRLLSGVSRRRHQRPGFHQGDRLGDFISSLSANVVVVAVWVFGWLMLRYFFGSVGVDKDLSATIRRYLLSWLPFLIMMALLDVSIQLKGWSGKRMEEEHRSLDIWSTTWGITTIYAITFSLVCIFSFAILAYRTIPFSLGGGQPRQVVFWLGSGDEPSKSFLERDGTTTYSVPYELLVESESSLVVVSPKDGQRAIEFDRKSVGAMVVLGKRWMAPAIIRSKRGEPFLAEGCVLSCLAYLRKELRDTLGFAPFIPQGKQNRPAYPSAGKERPPQDADPCRIGQRQSCPPSRQRLSRHERRNTFGPSPLARSQCEKVVVQSQVIGGELRPMGPGRGSPGGRGR